jgi:hypothetical protein
MAIQYSVALKNALLASNSLKEALESANAAPVGMYLFLFAGPVPATPDAALNMAADHTQVVKVAADATAIANGIVPLQLAATATAGYITKATAQTWKGLIDFDGVSSAAPSLAPTFFRLCAGGDNGRGAGGASSFRVQGTCGVVGADLLLPNATLEDNGTNEFGLGAAQFGFPA